MGVNNIGDSGISAIAEALGNCKINTLHIHGCNITFYGAIMQAAALSSNHTIRELCLWNNAITVEGALLIVKSAVDNTVCQYVSIDDKYKNDEVKKMMNHLDDRRSQNVRGCAVSYVIMLPLEMQQYIEILLYCNIFCRNTIQYGYRYIAHCNILLVLVII